MEKDTFRTLTAASEEVLYKKKNSKFYGYAFPIQSEDDVKPILEKIKKQHYAARHWCYAFQLGTNKIHFRANDDGEPNNSAGMPIYGQIQSFDLTNVLVVVVRYFGGIKLGVGGLVQAYKTGAQMALEVAEIEEKTLDIHYIVTFDYKNMNKVMRVIKEKNVQLIKQQMEMSCEFEISIRKQFANDVFVAFDSIYEVEIKEKE